MAENATLMGSSSIVDGVIVFGLGFGVRTVRNWDFARNRNATVLMLVRAVVVMEMTAHACIILVSHDCRIVTCFWLTMQYQRLKGESW
jgi:hypothetical protein